MEEPATSSTGASNATCTPSSAEATLTFTALPPTEAEADAGFRSRTSSASTCLPAWHSIESLLPFHENVPQAVDENHGARTSPLAQGAMCIDCLGTSSLKPVAAS